MTKNRISRRGFLCDAAVVTGSLAVSINSADAASTRILNYNQHMEYRRLGKTGLMVSAVCLGGHWKRIDKVIGPASQTRGWIAVGLNNPEFVKNRHEVVSRAIDVGINYIDACVEAEVLTYARVLKGRREQMYLGYSWCGKEARFPEWRTTGKLLQGLDYGLHAAGLDYVDLWRLTCYERGGTHTFIESEEIVGALEKAKQQGKARFTGISSHHRPWLKMMIEQHPGQIDVVLTPYTAASKVLPTDSLFDTVKKFDVGVFGIKPFASNSLFVGDGSPNSPHAEEDSRRARLAIRYILGNPAITAPIPGLISTAQVDNMAKAVMERRDLDPKETAELEKATGEMWAKLPPNYEWLKNWEYV